MKKIFFCLLLLNLQNLNAQSLKWFEGSLVLFNCDVLVGEISLDPTHTLILFQYGGKRMVYPAHQIQSLYFYDASANINRRYVSLKTDDDVRTSYQLFEIVIAGEVSVLRRKKVNAFYTYSHPAEYNYFVKFNDVLTPLRKFNRKIYPYLLSRSDKRLDDFVSINRLSTHQASSALRIIEFYNRLVKSDEPLARQ